MRMPRPFAGSVRSPVTFMIGQKLVSAKAAEVGKLCGGTVMVGTSEVPASTPDQSTRAESFDPGCGPRSLIGGVPVGIDVPPLCVYPGAVGTATPATAGSAPHSSKPLNVPEPPFLLMPERLVHAPGTLRFPVSHLKI